MFAAFVVLQDGRYTILSVHSVIGNDERKLYAVQEIKPTEKAQVLEDLRQCITFTMYHEVRKGQLLINVAMKDGSLSSEAERRIPCRRLAVKHGMPLSCSG